MELLLFIYDCLTVCTEDLEEQGTGQLFCLLGRMQQAVLKVEKMKSGIARNWPRAYRQAAFDWTPKGKVKDETMPYWGMWTECVDSRSSDQGHRSYH